MSKHTPGSWIDWNDEEDNWLLVQADSQQVIALFPKGDTESTKDEALANCQLCAAAPELLAALKDAVEQIEASEFPGPTDHMRDIIAKAEGKSRE